jgi:hypothetical protein
VLKKGASDLVLLPDEGDFGGVEARRSFSSIGPGEIAKRLMYSVLVAVLKQSKETDVCPVVRFSLDAGKTGSLLYLIHMATCILSTTTITLLSFDQMKAAVLSR